MFSTNKWSCFRLSKLWQGIQNGLVSDQQMALFSLDKNSLAASPLLPVSVAGPLPVAKEVPRRSTARPAWWRPSLLLCSSLYPNRRENPRQGRLHSAGMRVLTTCYGRPDEGFLLNHYQPAPLFTFCDPGLSPSPTPDHSSTWLQTIRGISTALSSRSAAARWASSRL